LPTIIIKKVPTYQKRISYYIEIWPLLDKIYDKTKGELILTIIIKNLNYTPILLLKTFSPRNWKRKLYLIFNFISCVLLVFFSPDFIANSSSRLGYHLSALMTLKDWLPFI